MVERLKELINILNEANKSYYQENREIMSDFQYDKLYDELKSLEAETGIIMANSPIQNVGHLVISKLKKVTHSSKVLSLDKTKEVSKLRDFLKDETGILSFKMDGLTVILKYNNGELTQAITRGNGQVGEDITHNAKFFKNIPLKINFKEELILRGEAIISFSEFERINSKIEDEQKYKNPRNLCSGTVRQLSTTITEDRNVQFMAFSLISESTDFNLKSEQLDFIKNLGFEVVYHKIVDKNNIEENVKIFQEMVPKNDFATDGLVLTFDNIDYSKKLGETSKFSKDSIAFKWEDNEKETTLLDVEWNTSRTGLVNPVAIFEPIELEGTTVTRASLHNLSIIEDLKLGIGDRIKVYKANMIIPQISENLTKSNNLQIPEVCNICGEKTQVTKLRDGKALKCTNVNCTAQIVSKIAHFVSRDAMNIEGFSKETIQKFVEYKFINSYVDIYNIDNFKDDIINLKGFGNKSYDNLINSIEKSKNVPLENFIYSLGIENVGLSNARLLVKYFNYDFQQIKNATIEEFMRIDGFGEVISKNIYNYFREEENIRQLEIILDKINIIIEENPQNNSDLLAEQIFVITGDVYKFKNRKELKKTIENLGGKVTSSVSKNTSYLINNDKNSSSSKNNKAKELGIKIISEEEFLNLAQIDENSL